MKKILLLLIGIFWLYIAGAQNKIEWSPDAILEFSDYQSPSTEINDSLNMFSINSTVGYEFSFSMSYAEFMFTKNFNSKVNTVFLRSSSYLTAPTRELAYQLVEFGKLEFDLAELSARKFRKRLLESKGTFSNTSFFQPLHDDIMAEQMARHSSLAKSTDMGRNSKVLYEERAKIKNEIEALADYCKACKPPKKKKH